MPTLLKYNKTELTEMKINTDYSLLQHNTFGIDVKCRQFVEFVSAEEAKDVAEELNNSCGEPFLILGSGSNVLLTRDFDGTVVHSAIRGKEMLDDRRVRVGSGENWDEFVEWTIANGLYGAENLSLIPGDVGSSAVQNIGAYGCEAAELIDTVEAVEISTGNLVTISAEECGYGYRESRFKHEWHNRFLITHVVYRLQTEFSPRTSYGNVAERLSAQGIKIPTAMQVRQTIIAIRREKLPDPAEKGNAGSFFMNPVVDSKLFEQLQAMYPDIPHFELAGGGVKIPAAWLIDQCGWKGRALGRAAVHGRQPLVLVNDGGATGNDVVTLCRAIQDDVLQKFGIELHPEVNII